MKAKQSEISIVAYQTPSGAVQFRVDTVITVSGVKHRIRRRGFSTKTAAIQWGETRAAEIRLGIGVEPPKEARRRIKDDPTRWTTDQVFEKLQERWRDRGLKPATIYTYTSKYRSHIKPVCGSTVFAEIGEMQVKQIAKDDPMTVAVFSVIMRDAARVGAVLPTVVFDPPPRKRNEKVSFFEAEEVIAMRDALPEKWRPLFVFLAASGLRLGEAMGLSWCDLDRRRMMINVMRTQVNVPHRAYNLPKSGKTRTVPISEVAFQALRDQSRLSHGVDWPDIPQGGDPLQFLVFPGERTSFRVALKKAAASINLNKPCNPHVARHTCGSLLVQHDVSLKVIGDILGHRDLSTTHLFYAHLKDDQKTAAANVLSDILSASN